MEAKIKLLSIAQAAALIPNLSVYGLEKMCKTGQMPHIVFGSKKLINETVLFETLDRLSRETPEYKPQKSANKNKSDLILKTANNS